MSCKFCMFSSQVISLKKSEFKRSKEVLFNIYKAVFFLYTKIISITMIL